MNITCTELVKGYSSGKVQLIIENVASSIINANDPVTNVKFFVILNI